MNNLNLEDVCHRRNLHFFLSGFAGTIETATEEFPSNQNYNPLEPDIDPQDYGVITPGNIGHEPIPFSSQSDNSLGDAVAHQPDIQPPADNDYIPPPEVQPEIPQPLQEDPIPDNIDTVQTQEDVIPESFTEASPTTEAPFVSQPPQPEYEQASSSEVVEDTVKYYLESSKEFVSCIFNYSANIFVTW